MRAWRDIIFKYFYYTRGSLSSDLPMTYCSYYTTTFIATLASLPSPPPTTKHIGGRAWPPNRIVLRPSAKQQQQHHQLTRPARVAWWRRTRLGPAGVYTLPLPVAGWFSAAGLSGPGRKPRVAGRAIDWWRRCTVGGRVRPTANHYSAAVCHNITDGAVATHSARHTATIVASNRSGKYRR